MSWMIEYLYKDVEEFILRLPARLSAKYFHLTELMLEFGANLGMSHTKPMSNGLFELRVKGEERIARVFYCTRAGKRIIILHAFIKKTSATPEKELRKARQRLSEEKMKHSELKTKALSKPKVKAAYDEMAPEFTLLRQMLKARQAAGLSQADVAERMGTKAPAVTRLESSLSNGKHSPSLSTLQKYAHALGYELKVTLVRT